MSHNAEKDAPEFQSVTVDWCKSANTPHLRYSVVWPDGTPDGWCSGRAPQHIGPRMRGQLAAARIRVFPPGKQGDA